MGTPSDRCYMQLWPIIFRTPIPILISKIDFDKAYLCVHVSASLVASSCFTFNNIGGINLHMNFGNKNHTSSFSSISDTVCNVSNTLLHSRSWNVTTLYHKFINVPSMPHLLQEPLLPVPAYPICINPTPAPFQQTDGYIVDLISVCPSHDNSTIRIAFVVPIACPVSSEELPCSHLASEKSRRLPLRMPNSAGLASQHSVSRDLFTRP